MNLYKLFTLLIIVAAGSPIAQDYSSEENATASSSGMLQESSMSNNETNTSEDNQNIETSEELLSSNKPGKANLQEKSAENNLATRILSPLKYAATVDMQLEKKMYDEFSGKSESRFYLSNARGVRKTVDDFWLRVAIRASYQLEYFESAFALRFYPYWTMRREGSFPDGKDLQRYFDVIEVNQAYLKGFKDYSNGNFSAKIHLKIGRDGLLNSCSQLFGNYLDQPAGGYGDSRNDNITGPFKNRKIFANQIEVGTMFNIGTLLSIKTSTMIGNNLNNEKWYGAPQPTLFQQFDSKLSAGFVRGYLDVFALSERLHFGTGFRNYSTFVDSGDVFVKNNSFFAQWAFDVTIIPDLKFYAEIAYQCLGFESSTGIVRPINIGITVPTMKILDVLAFEFENVADTYFSDKSMRDAIGGRRPTLAFGWGIVAEKRFADRFSIAWGLYTGNPTGDLKTTLRLTSDF